MDFVRHEQRGFIRHGFARQFSAPLMHQLAAQRAAVQTARDLVREAGQHAFGNVRIVGRRGFQRQVLVRGDSQEIVAQRADLTRGRRVNSQPAATIQVKIILPRIIPCAHEHQQVGVAPAEQFAASLRRFFACVTHQNRAPLGDGGD